MSRLTIHLTLLALITTVILVQCARTPARRWLPGDSHVHSQWSPSYDRTQNPPTPRPGGDAIYPTPENAARARRHGLSWMVTTDHGGPNHSRFNLEQAYPELVESRLEVPEVLQFYGMELNMPGMDHHTLIIPRTPEEWTALFEIESRFDANDAWPEDSTRDTETARLAALDYMTSLPALPLLFANHPSRSARGIGDYGLDEPWELRANQDRAPQIYRGMEGAPGHQAATLGADGGVRRDDAGEPTGFRGVYRNPGAHTLGGFDQMTAIVGGLWDALLGEGRRFWIVATSDSHVHYQESSRRGSDFWPGEFHKTYVHARHEYDDVLDGLREGRIFVVAGDLVTRLDVRVTSGRQHAEAGGTLTVGPDDEVVVDVEFDDPASPNASGDDPTVRRVDVIVGEVRGPASSPDLDRNETARVVERVSRDGWETDGETVRVRTVLTRPDGDFYVRVRGTNTDDPEPVMDSPGESPWADLWFYSNPIFVQRDGP